MRILIIKLGSIGDILHTLPAFAAIRRALPDAHIAWVAERRSAEILRGNHLIDELVEVDTHGLRARMGIDDALSDMSRQIRHLRKQKFDIAIDFQGLLKSAFIGQLSGAKRRWGFSKKTLREPPSRFLLTDTADVPSDVHVVKKNLILASQALDLDLHSTELEFPIFTTQNDKLEADAIIAKAGQRFAILNPAGGWVTKLWHAEKFGRLVDHLWAKHGIVSVVATGPKETELAEKVAAASTSKKLILEQPGLNGFYELAKRAAVYVGGDTGPTHLAVAAKAPVVGLFGPTEWWRNGSPYAEDICVDRSDIGCRIDCQRRKCDVWICMDFGLDAVAAAVEERMARAAAHVYV